MWSIIHHPGDAVAETNPMNIPEWREAFIDTGGNGFMTWRNAYQDEHDQIAQLYLKLRGNKGHSGPDALTFRMIALTPRGPPVEDATARAMCTGRA